MPIVHNPKTGQFTSSSMGGSAGGKKADPYAKTYPASSMTSLPAGAKSFKESGAPKPKEGTKVKLREGTKVYHATVVTPGPRTVSLHATANKMGRDYPEMKQSLWEHVFPAD